MNELEHLRSERKNLLRQLLKQDRAITRLIRVLHINRVALAKPNGIWGMKRFTPTEKQWKEWALGETGPLETRDKMESKIERLEKALDDACERLSEIRPTINHYRMTPEKWKELCIEEAEREMNDAE